MLIQICIVMIGLIANYINYADGKPMRVLVDTNVDYDDICALSYILKLDRSKFELEAITISAHSWTNPGPAVNEVYDLLYMMGRDDIAVGVGGEGGIAQDGKISKDVGGYLPIIEQGHGTAGYCRYSQVIPLGQKGRLDMDTKYGHRKSFLPRGPRSYSPLYQPTAQQVMIEKISEGPITVFLLGECTNFAILLMSNPQLKKNIKSLYVLGGGVRPSKSDLVCCHSGSSVYTGDKTTFYAEYNSFSDPFAAYKVIHSGIPVTLVPLDATNHVPITNAFLQKFEKNQDTFEAKYCLKIFKMIRDTWFDEEFSKVFFLWDSLTVGVATSIMLQGNNIKGDNEFAEMQYMNITVITSNEPYGTSDGSNPFFFGQKEPKFGLQKNGVQSGHVVTGVADPFCIAINGCKDGYTPEVTGPEGVRVHVAVNAKPNRDENSTLDKAFYESFLDVLNRKQQTGRFNFTTQFPHYKEILNMPDFTGRRLGKNIVFDMDMSAGDFLALLYILKVPAELINLKAILITPTGWASASTIDLVYDLLHMMGRDDIPVGLGDFYALNQTYPKFPSIGNCTYSNVIPRGCGGSIDSDTLYGHDRFLPRSPRRFTSENSVKHGARRDTDHPELRQPRAVEVWQSVIKSLDSGSNVTILTNGPLTSVAQIIRADQNLASSIQEIFILGGHLSKDIHDEGNVINSPNKYAELNMFLDPLAAKTVFDSDYNITLIPLSIQRRVRQFDQAGPRMKKTAEALFTWSLQSILKFLKYTNPTSYQHVDMFLGEILGAVILADGNSIPNTRYSVVRNIEVSATGDISKDGQMIINQHRGRSVTVLEDVDPTAVHQIFAKRLGDINQSAVIGSFEEQIKIWSTPQK